MASFKPEYMTGYFIGEGLSGLVPSVVALGQGVGQLTCSNVSTLNEAVLWTSPATYDVVCQKNDKSKHDVAPMPKTE
jgi:riboflavin transporter 2